MPESKRTYHLYLSEFTRQKLNRDADEARIQRIMKKEGAESARGIDTYTRANLSPYFHKRYEDWRSPVLISSRTWCLDERPYVTDVRLTDKQVSDILQLALEHDIDPKPNTKNPTTTAGITTYLLSTFLEAVARGYLRVIQES